MMLLHRHLPTGLLFAFVLSSFSLPSRADEPLPRRIDTLIEKRLEQTHAGQAARCAPRISDFEFARRIYLDFTGRIPTASEARSFVTNITPGKRAQLVDKLLAGSEFPRRMTELFNVMLMERRGENSEWTKFLRASFEANKPWDQLARELIDPDADNEITRGAAWFYTNRLEKVGQQETDYPGLTRDVGRLFLGMDLQCAQCHNHLFIDDYKQQDFQGLFAVYLNTFIRKDVKYLAIGENLMTKKLEFMSVFEKVPMQTGPRVPGGQEIEIPVLAKDAQYVIPPDKKKNFPGMPTFSPLELLAHQLPSAQNKAFADNIVNRLWFVMMGRGLVNPLDQRHTGNPPSHPELLDLLSTEIVAQKFDIKSMLRELALTETYQRSSTLPEGTMENEFSGYSIALERPLSAEQLLWSVLTATGEMERFSAAPTAATSESQTAITPLKDLQGRFVTAFGNAPKDPEVEFAPSVKSALFVLNDPSLLKLLAPNSGNLMERLSQATDARAVADELYWSVLTRSPSADELQEVSNCLAQAGDRRTSVLAQLAWALLSSTEFCLNH